MSKVVIVSTEKAQYPREGEFRPDKIYAESCFSEIANSENYVYEAVRKAFYLANYDKENYDTPEWNPLKKLIHPGDNVLLKPNLVQDYNGSGDTIECLYTQPSVIAAVLDYVVIALQGKGQVIIADAPMQSCNWQQLIEQSHLGEIVRYYQRKVPKINFILKDLRGVYSIYKHGVLRYERNPESRQTIVHLDNDSEFAKIPEKQLKAMRITNYDPAILNSHHNSHCHEYAIASEVLEADVIINLPKPKTHRKAGVTAALKNIVGTSARKEYLPHHTNGAKENTCGDEYLHPSFWRRLDDCISDKRNYYAQTRQSAKKAWLCRQANRVTNKLAHLFGEEFSEGSWYGNQTISKTITDLNKILFYADKNGCMHQQQKQRKYLAIADMIIAGEGEGPLLPTAKSLGLIALGENPVTFDEVIVTLFGANMKYMHAIKQAHNTSKGPYPLVEERDNGEIISDNVAWDGKYWEQIHKENKLYLKPTSGWRKAFYER